MKSSPACRRDLLSRGPATVSNLAGPLTMSLPAVMQYVQVLEARGLVGSHKVGRVRTCELEPEALGLAERWLGDRRAMCERRLDRLGDFLATLPQDSEDQPRANRKPSPTPPSRSSGAMACRRRRSSPPLPIPPPNAAG